MISVCKEFPVTDAEWAELEAKFDKLALYAGWQLIKMNAKNNHTDEIQDVAQELRCSIYRAGCYYKRQTYIEACLAAAKRHVKDDVVASVVEELSDLWDNKTRHGANRVKYGEFQQELLEQILKSYVPESEIPDRNKKLNIDAKFVTYCKIIVWNAKKSMGKKITREKSWRTGLVSLSTFDHLGAIA